MYARRIDYRLSYFFSLASSFSSLAISDVEDFSTFLAFDCSDFIFFNLDSVSLIFCAFSFAALSAFFLASAALLLASFFLFASILACLLRSFSAFFFSAAIYQCKQSNVTLSNDNRWKFVR